MLKISEAVRKIITKQPFFVFGISNKLFNLSNLARFIQPFVRARTKKEVTVQAIQVSLSRLQKEFRKSIPPKNSFLIKSLTVHKNLCALTFFKSEENYEKLHSFYIKTQREDNYMTLSQGMNELTTIISERNFSKLKKIFKNKKPKFVQKNLAAIGVQFDEKYYEIAGFVHYLIQQVTMQNINIVEFSSTYSELVFYVEEKDVNLAFGALAGLLDSKKTRESFF